MKITYFLILAVATSASNKHCNQIIASGFGAAESKRFFALFYSFRLSRRSIRRLWRVWRPHPPGAASPQLYAAFWASPSSSNRQTINSSRWRGLKRESEHRLEPMEGVDFIQKSLRSLRSRIQIIGSYRYAGPNRSTGPHPPSWPTVCAHGFKHTPPPPPVGPQCARTASNTRPHPSSPHPARHPARHMAWA